MQTLDSIFLDKLDQLYCRKPKLWAPKKNYYVTLLELNKSNMLIENEDGSLHRMPRQEVCEQSLLLPSKESTDWSNWRRYLFENRVDFIAPSSYILQSHNDNYHMVESIYTLPYLVTDIETGNVINAKGESLVVDINRYRFAKQSEIDRFLEIARKYYLLDIEWFDDKKVWSWSYNYKTTAVPKFVPGDLVALRDYTTGKIFDGGYYIKEIIKLGNEYNYKLLGNNIINEVVISEKCLVECEIVVKDKVTERVSEIIDGVLDKKEQKEKEEEDFLL